jgi:hypothetical protein
MNVREMLAQRAALVLRAREINAAAEKENRDLNAEEQGNYDKIFAEITALEKRQPDRLNPSWKPARNPAPRPLNSAKPFPPSCAPAR